ncbi:MAG: hypothetical protein ABIR15_16305 [Chitinophagaceae bacterium]
MNNTFQAARFWFLLKKSIYEKPFQLTGLTLLSMVAVLIIYAFLKTVSGFEVAQTVSFLTGLTGGCIIASVVYAYFSSNAMGYSFLTLPASAFEKWLCGILLTGLYLLLFLVFFRVMDTFFVSYFLRHLNLQRAHYKNIYESVTIFRFDSMVALQAFVMFLNFAGAMLVGSLYFNKTPFIKIALVICGVWCGAFVINLVIAKWMIPEAANAFPYLLVWINIGKDVARLDLPDYASHIVKLSFNFIIPAILWMLSYIRLKEKEF